MWSDDTLSTMKLIEWWWLLWWEKMRWYDVDDYDDGGWWVYSIKIYIK